MNSVNLYVENRYLLRLIAVLILKNKVLEKKY